MVTPIAPVDVGERRAVAASVTVSYEGGGPVGWNTDHQALVLATREDPQALLSYGVVAQDDEGDLLAARHWFDAAYRKAEGARDETTMAHAALGLSGLWTHEHRTTPAFAVVQARLERALSGVDPTSALGIRLRARLAAEADYRRGESAAIVAVLEEARGSGDPVALADALSLAHQCLLGPDDGTRRRALAEALVAESVRTGRRRDLLIGLLWHTVDLLLDADPHAERRLAELHGMLAESDHRAIRFVVSAIEVMLAIRAGKLDQAEALALTCAERGAAAGDVDTTAWHAAQLVTIRWYQGRLTELLPTLRELVTSPTLSYVDNSTSAMLAVAAAMAGDRQTATGILAKLRGRGFDELPRSSTWLITMYGIAEAAHLLGNAPAAARVYQLLHPYAHLPMMASVGVSCFGSVHHALGVAALTMGDADAAVEHLREAVHRNLGLAHWPAVITSRLRFAQALNVRAKPTDAAAASHQLAVAAQEAAMLGLELPRNLTPLRTGLAAALTRQGQRWRVELGGHHVLVRPSVGMLHLAVLTANPGVDIAAIDLVNGVNSVASAAGRVSTQQVLDRTAIDEYRQRLAQLREEIDDFDASDEPDRAAQARAERDWLLAELSANTGIGGRARRFSDDAERARIAVGRAIRRAVTRIGEESAMIGEHLRTHVHTGIQCSYRSG